MIDQQCVSASVAHPCVSSVVVFANGEHLTAQNVDSGEVVFCYSLDSPIIAFNMFVSAEKDVSIAVSTEDKQLTVLAESSGARKFSYVHRKRVRNVFQISDQELVFMDMFGEVHLLNMVTFPGVSPTLLFGHFAVITAANLVGNRILTGDRDEKFRVSVGRQAEVFCFGHRAYVSYVDMIGNFFVSTGADGFARLFHSSNGREISALKISDSLVAAACKHGNFLFVVAESSPDTVQEISVETGELVIGNIFKFPTHLQSIATLADGRLVGVSREGELVTLEKKFPTVRPATRQARFVWLKKDGEHSEASEAEDPKTSKLKGQ